MALNRTKLSDVVVVPAGSTVGIITVSGGNKVFVKSIIAHPNPVGFGATAFVYFVPNGGSANDNTRIFNITLSSDETTILEPAYPFVLDTNGDEIKVGAAGSAVNFIITGDKES